MEKKKSMSFYFMIVAAVLCAVGLFFYRKAEITEKIVFIGGGAAIVLTVLLGIFVGLKVKAEFVNLLSTISAVLLGWTLVHSFNAQLDSLGFWISGLYFFDQIKAFLYFAVCVFVAILLNLIASFVDVQK